LLCFAVFVKQYINSLEILTTKKTAKQQLSFFGIVEIILVSSVISYHAVISRKK